MIEIKNLSKRYGNSKELALKETTITIESGKIIGFIGHNGAGKSTTIKAITGIISPSTGDVLLNGHSIINDDIEAKKQFGYVADNPDVFLKLTGYQYLNFMANIYGVPADRVNERIHDLAKLYLMEDKLNDLIDSYSHGMRQKINVMGALIHEPSIFILDEPLTGLDPQASRLLKDSMREHADKGNTVFFSTHVLEVAEKLCDEIIIINEGSIVYQGSLEILKEKYADQNTLEDIFFAVVKNNA